MEWNQVFKLGFNSSVILTLQDSTREVNPAFIKLVLYKFFFKGGGRKVSCCFSDNCLT